MKLFEIFPDALKYKSSGRKKSDLKEIEYAFPRLKKLPLMSKRNILSAITHFSNVKGPTIEERVEAYKKVLEKAELFKICTMGFIEQCKGLSQDKPVLD